MEVESNVTVPQREFLESKAEFTLFKGGIGAGKTRILCTKAILKAGKEGRRFLLTSFSYPTLRDVCLETTLELLYDTFKIPFKLNRSEMTVRIGKGNILLRSADQPDRLRGINCDDWGIDEARQFKDRSVFDILIGRARKTKDAQGYISTTTKGRNWVYHLEDQMKVIKQSTLENPFLPDTYKDRLLKQYSSKFARQEIYADIVDMGAGVIESEWFKVTKYIEPKEGVRFWDLAVSIKTQADYSAGALCSVTDDERLIIHDIKRQKIEYPDLRKLIIQTAHEDGRHVIIGVEEAGQQLGFIQDLIRCPELRGYTIKPIKPEGDKLNRAMPWASRAEMGRVSICEGTWNKDFLEECSAFSADDTHDHDDQIDAVSGAYNALANVQNYYVWRARI